MIRIQIEKREQGSTLRRFLMKKLPKAPVSVFYQALRKNKIKIGTHRPKNLSEILKEGDEVLLYLTDEQLSGFGYGNPEKSGEDLLRPIPPALRAMKIPILYEDDQLLIVDKPAGIAVQKGSSDPYSLTEKMLEYLGISAEENQSSYRPSFCHRIDKNTRGLLIMAKTLQAHHAVDYLIKNRLIHKYYLAIVEGVPKKWEDETTLIHGYRKDRKTNQARLTFAVESLPEGYVLCESRVRLIRSEGGLSLVRVELITGKSHQIRAQLSFEGYPILHDGKYGSGFSYRQMLLSYELFFEEAPSPIEYMKGQRIRAALPDAFSSLIKAKQ